MWLGAVQAVINAFDMPARQSFLGQMVDDRADLPNAIALNSSMVNGARLIGPVFAAALVAAFGEGWCFAIDAASYVAVIASLLMMTVKPRVPSKRRAATCGPRCARAWQYVATARRSCARCCSLLAATSVLGGSYTTRCCRCVDGDDAGRRRALARRADGGRRPAARCAARSTSRAASSIVGLGGVIGALRPRARRRAVACLGFATDVYMATPLVFVLGTCLMVQMASTNTIVQTVVDSDKLGRVMSLYAVAFFGGAPLGALLEGSLSSATGVRPTFVAAGIAAVVCALVYRHALPRLRLESHNLYVRLGLIEE